MVKYVRKSQKLEERIFYRDSNSQKKTLLVGTYHAHLLLRCSIRARAVCNTAELYALWTAAAQTVCGPPAGKAGGVSGMLGRAHFACLCGDGIPPAASCAFEEMMVGWG